MTGPLCRRCWSTSSSISSRRTASRRSTAVVRELNGKTALLQTLRDYGHHKNNVWGITARNREQNFALNLLMNPEVDFVTLLGQAGTGKTLLALAAGLAQVLDDQALQRDHRDARRRCRSARTSAFCRAPRKRRCSRGWARSTTTSKCCNKSDDAAGEWGRAATQDLIRSRIKIKR